MVGRKSKWDMRRVGEDPTLERMFNHKPQASLGGAPGGDGQGSADGLLDSIAAATTETAGGVVGRVEHHAPKGWWSHGC